jgi:hypothetical protein
METNNQRQATSGEFQTRRTWTQQNSKTDWTEHTADRWKDGDWSETHNTDAKHWRTEAEAKAASNDRWTWWTDNGWTEQ